jgi:hypothetical protein
MNTGFRPIPDSMPIDAAANMMVRRGEAPTFFAAKARLIRQRMPDPQPQRITRVEITSATIADVRKSFGVERELRLPYRDD